MLDWSTMPCPAGVGWRIGECDCRCHRARNEYDADCDCCNCETCGRRHGEDDDCTFDCDACGAVVAGEDAVVPEYDDSLHLCTSCATHCCEEGCGIEISDEEGRKSGYCARHEAERRAAVAGRPAMVETVLAVGK